MTALAAQTAAAVELGPGVQATPVALTIPEAADFEDWAWVGSRLGNLANASSWWIADWFTVGYGRWGQLANDAAERFGFAAQTVYNMHSVALKIEVSRRRETLSFGHHVEVAALEAVEQDRWLDWAIEQEASVMGLREALRTARGLPAGTASPLTQLRIVAPPERAERWQSAAERAGKPFGEWAAETLDEAAA